VSDPYYGDDLVTHLADCRALLPSLPENIVDAVVTEQRHHAQDSKTLTHHNRRRTASMLPQPVRLTM
jgi:hypothetical protein